MSVMSEREKELWDEMEAVKAKLNEVTAAWYVEYRKRQAADEEERVNKLVEERLAAVARG